ncbi:hypothetical protein D3C71_1074880 [compost metagenome]
MQAVKQIGGRRIRKIALGIGRQHFAPVPIRTRQARGVGGGQRTRADGVERQARRQHQALLRAGHGHVHAPFVMAVINGPQGRNRVHHQQRGVRGAVDRGAHGGDVAGDAGGRFVMHDTHRLDAVLRVFGQARTDHGGVNGMAPVAFHVIHLQPQAPCQLLPQAGEVAGFHHQHAVARRQRIDQRRFPRARARRRKNHHGRLRLEDVLCAFQHGPPQRAEFGSAMVDGGLIDGAQDAVGHIRGPRNLQEVPAGQMGIQGKHASPQSGIFCIPTKAARRFKRLFKRHGPGRRTCGMRHSIPLFLHR